MEKLINYWEIITGVVAGIATWFGAQKIKRSNEKSQEASALAEMQKVYDTMTKQIRGEFEHLREDVKELKKENREQRITLRDLQRDNSTLHLEISKLSRENHQLKESIAKLRRENQVLRENQNK